MKLHDLRPAEGSKKPRTRKGRGIAANQGKTAGRGGEGQNSRSGGGVRPYHEGGQLPLVKRLPHRPGFHNRSRVAYEPVNLQRIAYLEGTVTPEVLFQEGIIKDAAKPVVILGMGELDHALTVQAHRFSASAKSKIEAAGGAVEVLPIGS